jgi:hypothetical protein
MHFPRGGENRKVVVVTAGREQIGTFAVKVCALNRTLIWVVLLQ